MWVLFVQFDWQKQPTNCHLNVKSWLVHRIISEKRDKKILKSLMWHNQSCSSWLKEYIFRAFNVGMNVHNHDTLTAVFTSYRGISSLHSTEASGLLGTDRKRVVLSVEGWSRLRTQHSSPDLDHWPACTKRDSETSAICRKPGGNDLTLRENIWPLLKVALSCRSNSRLTKTLCGTEFNPADRWSMGAW